MGADNRQALAALLPQALERIANGRDRHMTCHKPRDTSGKTARSSSNMRYAAQRGAHTQQAASLFLARLRDTLPPRSFSTGQYARVQISHHGSAGEGVSRVIIENSEDRRPPPGVSGSPENRIHQQNTCLFLNHNAAPFLSHGAVHFPYGGVPGGRPRSRPVRNARRVSRANTNRRALPPSKAAPDRRS